MKFDKPATSIDEQVSLLQKRGMLIDDHASAAHYLSHLNYYRLRSYWIPFESGDNDRFVPNTRFSDVINLYIFDRELRLLLLDAIERIEVSVRTQWAYQLPSLYNDPHVYLAKGLSKKAHWQRDNIERLTREIERSHETFIDHYKAKYTEPELPPAWMACEVMSLNTLSRWYSNLKPYKARSAISGCYGFDESAFEGYLEHLTCIRNHCAHHSRIWNRKLTISMPFLKTKPSVLASSIVKAEPIPRKLYNTITSIIFTLSVIAPNNHWRNRFLNLVTQHKIDLSQMGFPSDWADRAIWQ